jgi:hypothetical protein
MMAKPAFTILGLAVLDKIRFADWIEVENVLGGSVAFCEANVYLPASAY